MPREWRGGEKEERGLRSVALQLLLTNRLVNRRVDTHTHTHTNTHTLTC